MKRFLWTMCAALLAIGTAHAETAHAEGEEAAYAPRLMFVAIQVTDLDRSLAFYLRVLGMREFARYPGEADTEEVALTFAAEGSKLSGLEPTDSGAMLLLVHREEPLQRGNALSRIALGVPDVVGVVARAEQAGYEVLRPPSRIADGNRWVAFVQDPDGYRIELIGAARATP